MSTTCSVGRSSPLPALGVAQLVEQRLVSARPGVRVPLRTRQPPVLPAPSPGAAPLDAVVSIRNAVQRWRPVAPRPALGELNARRERPRRAGCSAPHGRPRLNSRTAALVGERAPRVRRRRATIVGDGEEARRLVRRGRRAARRPSRGSRETSPRVGFPRRGFSLPSISRTTRSSVPGVVRLKRSRRSSPPQPARPRASSGTIHERRRMPRYSQRGRASVQRSSGRPSAAGGIERPTTPATAISVTTYGQRLEQRRGRLGEHRQPLRERAEEAEQAARRRARPAAASGRRSSPPGRCTRVPAVMFSPNEPTKPIDR